MSRPPPLAPPSSRVPTYQPDASGCDCVICEAERRLRALDERGLYQPDAGGCDCVLCEAARDLQRLLARPWRYEDSPFAQALREEQAIGQWRTLRRMTRRERAAQALRALLNRCTARLQHYWDLTYRRAFRGQ